MPSLETARKSGRDRFPAFLVLGAGVELVKAKEVAPFFVGVGTIDISVADTDSTKPLVEAVGVVELFVAPDFKEGDAVLFGVIDDLVCEACGEPMAAGGFADVESDEFSGGSGYAVIVVMEDNGGFWARSW